MRRILLSAAAAFAMLSSVAMMAGPAEAMTMAAPVGVQAAISGPLAQDAAYVCRRVWRCGYYGCGWRRACWWTGPHYGYGYGYGPYWRRGYYHRHYWHHW